MRSKPLKLVFGHNLPGARLTLWVPTLVACVLSLPIVVIMGLGALLK